MEKQLRLHPAASQEEGSIVRAVEIFPKPVPSGLLPPENPPPPFPKTFHIPRLKLVQPSRIPTFKT